MAVNILSIYFKEDNFCFVIIYYAKYCFYHHMKSALSATFEFFFCGHAIPSNYVHFYLFTSVIPRIINFIRLCSYFYHSKVLMIKSFPFNNAVLETTTNEIKFRSKFKYYKVSLVFIIRLEITS